MILTDADLIYSYEGYTLKAGSAMFFFKVAFLDLFDHIPANTKMPGNILDDHML